LTQGQAQWAGGLGPHPVPGDAVGPYRLVALVGAGGLATVFRATDRAGSTVAVKVLNPARVLPEEVKRFTREYRALSRMDHPNVVKVYEAGVHQGYPWIAMEYVDGTDLDTVIGRWKAEDPSDRWERIAHIVRGLCRGLSYVHDLGLIHRDLKPSNVLLTAKGEPKLSDFGVVKSGDGTQTTQLTMAGRLVGTVAFMAPELITDEGVDARTDLYALGAVLYLMCTYRRPIEADSVAGYLARHLTEIPRPIGEIDPSVPPVLERVCARLLQKDRAYRYPSAQAVLQALDRSEDPDAPPLRGRDDQQTRWTRRVVALSEGAGGVVGWVGPAGSGKSHLLRTLAAQAQSQGLRVVTAQGGARPLLQIAEQLDLATDRIDARTVASAVGKDALVIAVDDLDQAGPEVTRALARLVRQRVAAEGERLLLAYTATCTAAEAEHELAGLGSGLGVPSELHELGPVEPKVVVAMLRDRGVTGPIAPLLARRLHADYAGQPGPMMLQVDALADAGWLQRMGDGLRATRPLDEFRKADLPVSQAVGERLLEKLQALEPEDRELCEVLALIDRPSAPALLERCRALSQTSREADTQRRIDGLVKARVLARTHEEEQEQVRLADPYAARVIRATLRPEAKRRLHGVIAQALASRKRREGALEVATHLRAAGDDAGAYPLYVQAARRVAREGRFGEVLDICDAAEQVRAKAETLLDAAERPKLARWLHLLRGEALLARQAWDEAVAPLAAAAEAARQEGDTSAIARTTGSLGRAHYRAGRFAEAEPLLSSALRSAEQGAPERAAALRALADIALRGGRLEEAEGLWSAAMDAAASMGSRDAVARAKRGLAHLRAIQGRLQDAVELLGQADDLLNPDGDHRVRAGVLARAIELDTASGRFGASLYRAETLVELARRHGMGERLPDAYALLSDLLWRLGEHEESEDAAQQSLVFANATDRASWDSRMRTAHVLADLGKHHEAFGAMPAPDAVGPSPVDDPPAQFAALSARLYAEADPARARDLATWALTRPPPLLLLSGVRIAQDAASALLALGHADAARNAVKRGLKLLSPADDGLRLELLVIMQRASPDPRVMDAIRQIALRMTPLMPQNAVESFRARDVIRLALMEPGV
jgi:tetratricopeptide (TPR) repeat protein